MNNNNYLEMIKQNNPNNPALIYDNRLYTYGELVEKAIKLSKNKEIFPENQKVEGDKKYIHIIQKEKILDQLLEFFACSENNKIPLIVPNDRKDITKVIDIIDRKDIQRNACMAVMTSGTSGKPKILFRTYESWVDFFPIQNKIFNIKENSRLFVQGSLAFTGNLNLYLAQFFAGAVVIAENVFDPRKWKNIIEREQADGIYLIPSKLICLLRILEKEKKRENDNIKVILSGSQGFSGEDARELKQYFPQAEIIYYYGASELSYLTYIKDQDMTKEKNLVGKPFPGIKIWVQQGEIFVDTPYHVEGISCPCTISDKGYFDENGNLYFNGRSDDILEIHGRKISAVSIEQALEQIEGIEEAAVIKCMENNKQELIAFVLLKRNKQDIQKEFINTKKQGIFLGKMKKKKLLEKLKNDLEYYEMPDKMIAVKKMPRTDSGKIEKRKLKQEWTTFFTEKQDSFSCI